MKRHMGSHRQLHPKGPIGFDPVHIDHPGAIGDHEIDRLTNFIRHPLHHLMTRDVIAGSMQKP